MLWIEQHWYRITPLHLLLLPLSLFFALLSAIRRALYRVNVLHSTKLPIPVIIVGNITVGGSGKTPLALWLVQQLIDEGWHPAIISRGYRGSANNPQAVYSTSNAAIVGDEPLLMAQRKLCPVWIGRNRAAAAAALLREHPECDVIISDDGLQHYSLQRDIEIVVVDGIRRFGNGLLLPAGPLRELPRRLNTADAVVINGGEAAPDEWRMNLYGEIFYNLLNPETTARSADFRGMKLHAIAGIGHPERFFRHLEELGLTVERHPLRDHHHYTPADLAYDDAEAILMTEKDAVKCAKLSTQENLACEKCWVLRVEAQLDPTLTQLILDKIKPHGRQTA